VTARRIVLALALVVVLVLAGGYAALSLTGGDAPPPPRPPSGPSGSATGTWRPAGGSFVGYRVDEKYLGVGVRTAVGRTG